MLTSVQVHNYQSLQDVSVLLGPLTVIVGPSNTGKSAFVRAMQAWAFNQNGTDFITRGEKFTSVTVAMDDAESISWTKQRAGGAEYSQLGNVFTKLGTSVPDEIRNALNIERIDIDGTKMLPQFAGQFDSPFLLTESAAKAARVIAKVTHLDVVMTAASAANKDLRRAKQKADSLEEQTKDKQDALISYAGLPARKERLVELEKWAKEVEEAAELAREDTSSLRRLTQLDSFLSLPTVPLRAVQEANTRCGHLSSCMDVAQELRVIEATLKAPTISSLVMDAAVTQAGEAFQDLSTLEAIQAIDAALAVLDTSILEQESSINELNSELRKFGTCPTCGGLTENN